MLHHFNRKKEVDKYLCICYDLSMNLSQALKLKNRLAGELVRQQEIVKRENARRSDNVSSVDRNVAFTKAIELSNQLSVLKGKITKANVNIYPALERMAELKSRIAFIQGLDKHEGPEVAYQWVGKDQKQVDYMWSAYINQQTADTMVAKLQTEINALQDQVDIYNSQTSIEE